MADGDVSEGVSLIAQRLVLPAALCHLSDWHPHFDMTYQRRGQTVRVHSDTVLIAFKPHMGMALNPGAAEKTTVLSGVMMGGKPMDIAQATWLGLVKREAGDADDDDTVTQSQNPTPATPDAGPAAKRQKRTDVAKPKPRLKKAVQNAPDSESHWCACKSVCANLTAFYLLVAGVDHAVLTMQ